VWQSYGNDKHSVQAGEMYFPLVSGLGKNTMNCVTIFYFIARILLRGNIVFVGSYNLINLYVFISRVVELKRVIIRGSASSYVLMNSLVSGVGLAISLPLDLMTFMQPLLKQIPEPQMYE
jgi:hypothetical protein